MTINVVCRKDAINRNHLAPLALVFTHDRRRKFVGLGISVGISVLLKHWDFEKQRPCRKLPRRRGNRVSDNNELIESNLSDRDFYTRPAKDVFSHSYFIVWF